MVSIKPVPTTPSHSPELKMPSKAQQIGKDLSKAKWESLFEADTYKELQPYKNMFLEALCRVPLVVSVLMISFACCWGPLFACKLAAGYCLTYAVYGIIKGLNSGIAAFWGLDECIRCASVDWKSKCDRDVQLASKNQKSGDAESGGCSDLLAFDSVTHVVILPNYKEPVEKLHDTVSTLAEQSCANQLVVVLAMEDRDDTADASATVLAEAFGSCFAHLFVTKHVLQDGEVVGKSSNENWAARCVKHRLVDEWGYDPKSVTVTVADADTYFHPEYFAMLTYKFCTDPNRYERVWQGPTNFYPNIWEVPMMTRVKAVIDSIGFLGQLTSPFSHPLPFAIYTLSLDIVIRVNFWDGDVVPEDWHMYLKCFFGTAGRIELVPMFLPVGNDAVCTSTYVGSMSARYIQAKRHAWGAIDIAYIIVQSYLHPEISLVRKLRLLCAVVEHHINWTLFWFALFLSGLVAPVINPEMSHLWLDPGFFVGPFRVRGFSGLLAIVMMGMLLPVLLFIRHDFVMRNRVLKGRRHFYVQAPWYQVLFGQTQWMLMPVTDFLYGSCAGLHAQLHMFYTTHLEYKVTEKFVTHGKSLSGVEEATGLLGGGGKARPYGSTRKGDGL